MEYEVRLTAQAERDIEGGWRHIVEASGARAADAWRRRIIREIESLEAMPRRFPLDPRAVDLNPNLRFLSVFSHRIVYDVNDEERQVIVIRVWHNARKRLTMNESAPSEPPGT